MGAWHAVESIRAGEAPLYAPERWRWERVATGIYWAWSRDLEDAPAVRLAGAFAAAARDRLARAARVATSKARPRGAGRGR
jgi:hypothetical protein